MSPEDVKSIFDWIVVGLLLLTFVAGYGALHFGNKVSAQKDEQLRQFDKDLTDAKTREANAEKELKEVKNTAGDAYERAGKLENDNLKLRGQVATLETGMADAKAKQADAERSLLEVKQQIQPRELTSSQRDKLIDLLKGIPKGPVSIRVNVGDGEALAYATQIKNVFEAAGWALDSFDLSLNSGPVKGAGFLIRTVETALSYGPMIQEAFRTVGVKMGIVVDPGAKPDRVEIVIGTKQ